MGTVATRQRRAMPEQLPGNGVWILLTVAIASLAVPLRDFCRPHPYAPGPLHDDCPGSTGRCCWERSSRAAAAAATGACRCAAAGSTTVRTYRRSERRSRTGSRGRGSRTARHAHISCLSAARERVRLYSLGVVPHPITTFAGQGQRTGSSNRLPFDGHASRMVGFRRSSLP